MRPAEQKEGVNQGHIDEEEERPNKLFLGRSKDGFKALDVLLSKPAGAVEEKPHSTPLQDGLLASNRDPVSFPLCSPCAPVQQAL